MIQERTPEDRLREEYFDLLPEITRVALQLEAEIRFYTLPVLHGLRRHEQLVVESRIKECESAINTLRDKQEGRTFDPNKQGGYSLLELPDLAGVRVLVFPGTRLIEVDRVLRDRFSTWISKPVKDDFDVELAAKYYGCCETVSRRVKGEYQIVPMLLGLFWKVEHSAMYKFKAVATFEEMKKNRASVESALARFEEGIESFVQAYTEPPHQSR
jgi:ppGpp synthetase/RelA/SpoT-type nucleotidyltranferase